MLADYGGAIGLGVGLWLLWMFLCVVYAILLFCIPFILYGIMRNTKRSADLLAEIRSFQEASTGPRLTGTLPPALPTPVPTMPKVLRPPVNLRLNEPVDNP
jgi:hypothetical protein